MIKINYIDLGLKEYQEAWNFQEENHARLIEKKNVADSDYGTLIFCEHSHVYTLGKSGQQNNLLINDDFLKKINATYYQSNRGGDITYHGPGQLVGYPIFDLEKLNLGVKEYIGLLEESIIDTLKEYNITATRMEKATGVWLDVNTPQARKICAIGVRVSKAVTMHGFALNINTDLKYFSYINPCGFIDKGVTSMQKELSEEISIDEVKHFMKKKMARRFKIEIIG